MPEKQGDDYISEELEVGRKKIREVGQVRCVYVPWYKWIPTTCGDRPRGSNSKLVFGFTWAMMTPDSAVLAFQYKEDVLRENQS